MSLPDWFLARAARGRLKLSSNRGIPLFSAKAEKEPLPVEASLSLDDAGGVPGEEVGGVG